MFWAWLLSSFLEILPQGENCFQLDDAWQQLEKHPWEENAVSWVCDVFLVSCNEKQDHIPVTFWQMLSEVCPVRGAELEHALVQSTSSAPAPAEPVLAFSIWALG